MAKKDSPPPAMVEKTVRGLSPMTAYDDELIDADAIGTEYDLIKRTRRSLPQLRMYWGILRKVVEATDRWPTTRHLHDDLKMVCGFRRQVIDMETGEIGTVVDSIAFDSMDADEFRVYFDKAMEKLGEAIGIDPLTLRDK